MKNFSLVSTSFLLSTHPSGVLNEKMKSNEAPRLSGIKKLMNLNHSIKNLSSKVMGLFLLVSLFGFNPNAAAQTTLSVGDLSIIGFQLNAPDSFAFVTWVDIAPNTYIKFTDNGFLAASAANLANNARGGENFVIWSNNGTAAIPAGTVITIVDTPPATTNKGTIVSGSLNGLSSSGDNIFAYQGAATSGANPDYTTNVTPTTFNGTILFGLYAQGTTGATSWITTGIASPNNSYLPTELNVANGNIAFGSLASRGQYTGARNNQLTLNAYKALVTNAANWTPAAGVGTLTLDATSFTVLPKVSLSVSSNTGTETGATVITVTATADAAVTGDQTVNLAVTGTGITAGDYTLNNTTITILNGQTTGTATFTVVDDSAIEINETAVLTISTPSAGIQLGTTVSQNVVITDNDPAFKTAVTPYVLPVAAGVTTTAMLTVPETVGGYKMCGIPDGLGAFDNNDGTFTLLMNHELANTVGSLRAHGAVGAFVSKWIIKKSDLSIISGSDLITALYGWDTALQTVKSTPTPIALNRFCSADLPAVSAYYNAITGLGSQERIYMCGEEGGTTGYQLAAVASGADMGKAYILGKFNVSTNGSGLTGVGAWENALANPFVQNKTVVIGNNDGGTGVMNNSVCVYQGTKTNTGTEVDKAGLTNGTIKFVNVTGNALEIPAANATSRVTNITSGTAFTLSATTSTTFSRPEDGAWDPADPTKYYFVTTDRVDQVADGIGGQIGRSRLWRLNFTDISNPDLGGTIDMLLDGTEGQVMMDNMGFDKFGHIILLEDVGGAPRNGKVWQYTISTDQIKLIAKHDPARFGDIASGGAIQPATLPFNNDEETSGIIDMSDILGAGNFLFVDQAHYNVGDTEAVEGGQLLKLYNPDSTGPTFATATFLETVIDFEVLAYPNPFDSELQLNFKTLSVDPIVIKVYDMNGKLLESRKYNAGNTTNQKVGSNYASGMYIVAVTQGSNSKTLKVVKR
jgi:Secretion system C-terminal sorting domain